MNDGAAMGWDERDRDPAGPRERLWVMTARLRAAIDEIREISSLTREAPDEGSRPGPRQLDSCAAALELRWRWLSAILADDRPPEWRLKIRIGGTEDDPEHVLVRHVWNPGLRRFEFVDVPPQVQLIVEAIDRLLEAGTGWQKAEFEWTRFLPGVDETV